jgi:hypothetical protein
MTTNPTKTPAVKKTTASAVSAPKTKAPVKTSAAKPAAKAVKPTAPKVTAKPASPTATKTTPAQASKVKKLKMVRDSFTFPKPEYAVLDILKLRAAKLGKPVKKTELLRAGLKAIAAMSDTALLAALHAVPSLKTGRPAKG